MGSVGWTLLALMLLGSVPGVLLGTQWPTRAPVGPLRSLLAILLVSAGVKVLAT